MIKDSKLIGTKIAVPYGWKKFKVGELFDFVRSDTPRLGSFVSNDTVFLIKATSSNNGVDSVFKSYTGLCYKNILTIGMRGSFKVFLHTSAVVLGDNVAGFKLKDITYSSSNRVLLFLGCLLEKLYSYGSGYAGYPTWSKLESHDVLSIPITSADKPDFAWMEQYMKLVQEDYLKQKELSNQAEIKAYLTDSHTDSLAITDADRQFLRDFEKSPRRKFKVGELFVPTNPKRYALKISDVIDSKGTTVVVSSTTVNQGIKGCSSMKPLVTGGKIVYSDAVGPTMMFYQESDFIADAHVKYLKPKFTVNMSKNMALYLITCIQKSTFGVYSYGNKYNNDAVNNTIVELPVIDSSQVDVHSIEKYMRIQVKLTIAKRKSYLDHELELMKQV